MMSLAILRYFPRIEVYYASMLTEQEKGWMEEYAQQFTRDISYNKEDRYVERIIMPNFFDTCYSFTLLCLRLSMQVQVLALHSLNKR